MAKLTETPMRANKPQPSVSLSEEDLPEIKSWKVGGKYSIILEVELTRLSKGDVFMDEKDRKYEASFKITSATTEGGEQEKAKAEEEKASRYPENKVKIDVMKEKIKKIDEGEADED